MSKRGETRDSILNAAAKLFHRNGFDKTSMDEIAKVVDKAKGALYYYFPSKEYLYKEVVRDEMLQIEAQLEQIVDNGNLVIYEKLKQYLLLRMKLIKNSMNFSQTSLIGLREKTEDRKVLDCLNEVRNDFDRWETAQFVKIIQIGILSNDLKIDIDVSAFADMMIMLLKGLEVQFIAQNKYNQYILTFNSLVELLISSIQTISMMNMHSYTPIDKNA